MEYLGNVFGKSPASRSSKENVRLHIVFVPIILALLLEEFYSYHILTCPSLKSHILYEVFLANPNFTSSRLLEKLCSYFHLILQQCVEYFVIWSHCLFCQVNDKPSTQGDKNCDGGVGRGEVWETMHPCVPGTLPVTK
jgi:hypothetical protein